MLFKNKKGIVHALLESDPKTQKWLDSKQITPLTETEIAAYAKSRGVRPPKKGAAEPGADAPKSKTDILREEYLEVFGEEADPTWAAATLKKKLAEAAPIGVGIK